MSFKSVVQILGPVMGTLHRSIESFSQLLDMVLFPFLKSTWLFHIDLIGINTIKKSRHKIDLPEMESSESSHSTHEANRLQLSDRRVHLIIVFAYDLSVSLCNSSCFASVDFPILFPLNGVDLF